MMVKFIKNIFRKSLVIAVIILFLGANVTSGISGNIGDQNKDIKLENTTLNEKINIAKGPNEPNWQWAKSAGGIHWDEAHGIAVDGDGNLYVTGRFSGTATFGSTVLVSQGGTDVFVAKLNVNGEWQWAFRGGGTADESGDGIAVDGDGNLYITGSFTGGTATFGDTTLFNQGYFDVFVAKLNSSSEWQWAKGAGGTDVDGGAGIAVDGNGNAYITGLFHGTATFGSTTLVAHGDRWADVFVAKLNTYGEWQWAKGAGGEDLDNGAGIAVDVNGNVYITGSFAHTATFGSTVLISLLDSEIFVAKLNANGDWLWAKNPVGVIGDEGLGIAVDGDRNVYITGYFYVGVAFGSNVLVSKGWADVFVAKINTNGEWQWAKSAGGADEDEGVSIAVDGDGNVYVTGYFLNVAKFGSTQLTGQIDYYEIFIAKLNVDREWQWAVRAGGPENDEGYGVAVDVNGNIYFTGYFCETATFGSITLVSQGSGAIFVASIGSGGAPNAPIVKGPTSGKPGISYEYTFVSTDPDGDKIAEYIIEWGDGKGETITGGPSGTPVTKSHTWDSKGTYTIKAKAKDTNGLESDWGTLQVKMPRNRAVYNLFFRFFERFPLLEVLLKL